MSTGRVALVTGVAGFCGRHLAAHLLNSGYEVAGFDRQSGPLAGVPVYEGDICDSERLAALLTALRPQVIFHLAALTDPRLDYQELHRVNALGTLALLEAVHQVCPEATVLIASTSAVYGRAPEDALPIGEEEPFRPVNLYAVSKIVQEMIAYQYFAAYGIRVIRSRAFNLTGPGESPRFVASAFAQQIAEIEAGQRAPVLFVGNLDTVRDFTDVRDAMRAYRLLVERGAAGAVYNVCSEQGTPIRRLLQILLGLSRRDGIAVRTDPARFQVADTPAQIGSAAQIRALTGWSAAIPLEETLRDVLDDWRRRVREET